MKVYIKTRTGSVDSEAIFNIKTNEMTVLKGSLVSTKIDDFSGSNKLEKIRADKTENSIVNENITFKSPSTAANFVTGRSSNGWIVWKDEKGRKLRDAVKDLEQ